MVINAARGGTIDLEALKEGLRNGRISAVALDIPPLEPLDPAPWLEGRLVITPHAALYSPEGVEDMRQLSALCAVGYLRTGALRSCVNLDAPRWNGPGPTA